MTALLHWIKLASARTSSASHAICAHTVCRRWCVCVCGSACACMYLTPHLSQWPLDVVLAQTLCSRKERMFALFKGEAIKEKAVSLHPKHELVLLVFSFSSFLLFFCFPLTPNLVKQIQLNERQDAFWTYLFCLSFCVLCLQFCLVCWIQILRREKKIKIQAWFVCFRLS